MKKLLFAVLALLPSLLLANPAPFGLEIGKATVKEAKQRYTLKKTGINAYSHGEMYEVSPRQLGLDGLKDATLIFDRKGVLVAVLMTLDKGRFDRMHEMLRTKYKVVNKQIPFVGNKSVDYQEGNTSIQLRAPHLSFDMTLNYLDKGLLAEYRRQREAERQRKAARERSQL